MERVGAAAGGVGSATARGERAEAARGAETAARARVPRRRAILVAALGAAAALMAAFYLSWPFTTDQGIFAWVGERIVAGGLPYRDAWDTKGPAAYYLTAPAVLLFGHDQWGFRLYDLLWLVAGAAAVGTLVRRLARHAGAPEERAGAAALTAAALLVLWFLSLDPYNTAQPDGWAAFVLTLGAAALVRGARSGRATESSGGGGPTLRSAALFGACVGVATLVKPTYGLYGCIALVYLALVVRGGGRRAWRTLVPPYAALAAGFVAVLAACIAWFAAHGALGDMLDVYLRFGPTVYAQTDADPALVRVRLMEQFLVTRFGVALPLVAAGAVWLWRRARAEGAMLLTWVAVVLVNVLLQGRALDFAYRWLSLFPAFAALAAAGVLALRETTVGGTTRGADGSDSRTARGVAAAVVATVLVAAAFAPAYHAFRWAKYVTGRSTAAQYYTTELGPEFGWYGGPESMGAIVDYVKAHTRPTDAVLVWDAQPGVNFLAERRSPVRFAWSGALTYGEGTPARAAYRREYLASVAAAPPLYVVALDDATCAHHSSRSLWCLKSFPALQAWVGEHYVREANVYAHDILRRTR